MAEDDPDRRPRAFLMINMEMDGEDITRHSMRELSAVLFLDDKSVIAEFDVKLKAIEGRCVDERCMSTFWEHQQDAWGWVLADAFTPNQAMARFAHFLTVHGVIIRYGVLQHLHPRISHGSRNTTVCLHPLGHPDFTGSATACTRCVIATNESTGCRKRMPGVYEKRCKKVYPATRIEQWRLHVHNWSNS